MQRAIHRLIFFHFMKFERSFKNTHVNSVTLSQFTILLHTYPRMLYHLFVWKSTQPSDPWSVVRQLD